MSKKGPNSLANMVRGKGYDLVSNKSGKIVEIGRDNKVNPLGYYTPDTSKYKAIWTMYDMNQCVSRYVWKGLPNGLDSWTIEKMLYFRQCIAGFKLGGKIYILPFVVKGGLNPYGKFTKIHPIPFNGGQIGENDGEIFNEDFNLDVNEYGDEVDEYKAVLLYDSIPTTSSGQAPSRFSLNQFIIEDIAVVMGKIKSNILISAKKILLQIKDPAQKKIIEEELQQIFCSETPYGLITSALDTMSIQSSSDFSADEFFNAIKNYDAIRCMISGIDSKGFGAEKKERLVTGELSGEQEQKDLVLDLGLELRQMFCDKMNKLGCNISVRKRNDDYNDDNSTETNGNDNDDQEELEAQYE